MKFLTFLLLFIIISCTSTNHSTSTNRNSDIFLKEYTYLVFHNSEKGSLFCAGFFTKHKKDLYFITANHIAAIPEDSITILIDPQKNIKIQISIEDGKKRKLETNFAEYDLYIKKVNSYFLGKVSTINKFIPDYKHFDFSNVKHIIYFGFPNVVNEPVYDFKKVYPSHVKSEDTIVGTYNYIRYSSKLNKYDTINYITKSTNGSYSGEGDSGAPVFFKIGNQYYFGGMCTAGVGSLAIAYILRPEKLLDSLSRFANRN